MKKVWQQLIIDPSKSTYLSFWKFIVYVIFFLGYLFDPYFIAFNWIKQYGQVMTASKEVMHLNRWVERDITWDVVSNIIIGTDILITSFTIYQVDAPWEVRYTS